jgi:RNA polymerase sigma factor (sigma-70 family)
LFHITQNLIRNALRRRRRRPCIQMSDLAQSSELRPERLVPDDGESPSQPLERTELAARVRAAMEGLGRRQRQALILHQFQHRTCADIADAMDMSPNAAKALLYRARLELRDALFPIVSG